MIVSPDTLRSLRDKQCSKIVSVRKEGKKVLRVTNEDDETILKQSCRRKGRKAVRRMIEELPQNVHHSQVMTYRKQVKGMLVRRLRTRKLPFKRGITLS